MQQSASPLLMLPQQSQASQWDQLRKEARQLERELDSRLVSYANVSSKSQNSAGSGLQKSGLASASSGLAMEREIEGLLSSLTKVVEGLAAALERQYPSSQAGTMNPSMMHALQKHRDQLFDFSKEFRRIKTSFVSAREHAELLGNVRQDIDQYKSSSQLSGPMDSLMNERRKIDGVHRLTDAVVDTAYEARNALINQRNSLMNSSKRTGGVFNQLPSIGNLIGKIQTRKRRDAIIMGIVIGLCIAFILMYMTGTSSST